MAVGGCHGDKMSVRELFDATGTALEDADETLGLLARYTNTVPDANATMITLREHLNNQLGTVPNWLFENAEVTPFTSKLKYSQVVVDGKTLRLGAPEFILSETAMQASREAIEERAGAGLRVLAFVEVDDGEAKPLLFVALSNGVRENAPETFEEFARQGVEVKVISGDNPLTVSKVALEARIEGAERYVDASTLDTPEKIAQAVRDYTVFGRVKPEQKRQLVEALQAEGKRVAMTGDGVNDILAMKKAECSIAMGTGSDAARQAAQVVLLDSDFSHMRQIVSEGRRDINNITRSATLFLYKNIFSLSMALFAIFGAFVYPLTPNQVSLISLFNIGLPAFLLTFGPNEKKQEGRFIVTVLMRAIPAALTSFIAIADMMLFAELFGISKADVSTASTYLLSVVGFLILVNLIQPPTKYRVLVFVVCVIGLIICCGFLWELFDIYSLSPRALVLCIVFTLAQIGVLQMLSVAISWIYRQVIARKQAEKQSA